MGKFAAVSNALPPTEQRTLGESVAIMVKSFFSFLNLFFFRSLHTFRFSLSLSLCSILLALFQNNNR